MKTMGRFKQHLMTVATSFGECMPHTTVPTRGYLTLVMQLQTVVSSVQLTLNIPVQTPANHKALILRLGPVFEPRH